MKKLIPRTEDASSWMSEDEILRDISNIKLRGGENIHLQLHSGWGDAEMSWHYESLENDEEYEQRLKDEEKKAKELASATKKKQAAILAKREKDRALYEKLKKEFGE